MPTVFFPLTPNAVGVKLRLAATEPHPGPSRDAARCQLQLLVGRTAYRGGLTWETPTHAMEVIPGHCHAIAPATSSRSPARHRVARVPDVRSARSVPPGPCGGPTRPALDTPSPWQASPCGAALMLHAP